MLSYTWRQEEACDNHLWVSLKATGYSQATHLAQGLQSFENEAKKMSYEDGSKTASACLEVTAKTTFIHVPGREYTGNTSKSGEGQDGEAGAGWSSSFLTMSNFPSS